MKSLTKRSTCLKNSDYPVCINLLMTIRQKCFQNSKNIEVGLFDFDKLIVGLLKTVYKKQKTY